MHHARSEEWSGKNKNEELQEVKETENEEWSGKSIMRS
jgi:hypothetical protein